MHRRLVFLSLLLAGCVGQPPEAATPTAVPDDLPQVAEPIELVLDVGSLVSMPVDDDLGAEDALFDVPPGYTALRAKAEWACATQVCSYGIVLFKDGTVVKSDPDGTKELVVDVSEGAYEIGLRSTGPGGGMTGKIVVTLSAE